MNRFLTLCAERGITTFLVTNGTNPDALRAMDPLPTQLYVSVTAPNAEVFRRLTMPAQEDAWERLLESLEIVRGLKTRRVVRHTLVRGWNLGWVDQYAELDARANPNFVEPKGYVYMGKSRQRLGRDHVPALRRSPDSPTRSPIRPGPRCSMESPESKVLLLGRPGRGALPARAGPRCPTRSMAGGSP